MFKRVLLLSAVTIFSTCTIMAMDREEKNDVASLTQQWLGAKSQLVSIAMNPRDARAFDATLSLYERGPAEEREFLLRKFMSIAENVDNPKASHAAFRVWKEASGEPAKTKGKERLIAMSQSPENLNAFDSANYLWEHGSADEKPIGLEGFRKIARHLKNPETPSAAYRLWKFTRDEADRELGKQSLIAMARSPENPNALSAARLLAEFGDAEERIIGNSVLPKGSQY